jgi:hypothetical protein
MHASDLCSMNIRITIGPPPNVQDEPRPWLARAVLLGARIVTAMVVGSGALLGIFLRLAKSFDVYLSRCARSVLLRV